MRKEDYGDRKKRKLHNAAVDKLNRLIPKLGQQEDSEAILTRLLNHEDSRVRIYACMACRNLDVLHETFVHALRAIIVAEPDATLKMSASMLLKQYMEE